MNAQRTARTTVLALAALALLAFAGPLPSSGQDAAALSLLYGPYTTAVSPGGASVHWISPPGVDGSCQLLGDAPAAKVKFLTTPIPDTATILHTAVFTGLLPDQRHYYAVTTGGDRAEGSFRTPPANEPRKPFTFVVTGDTQTFPPRIRAGFEAIAKEAPAFLLHTGDLCDDGQEWTLWASQFFGPARELLRQIPIWPARGNHEHGVEPFATMFGLPSAQPWYSFDYDNLHVAVLDQWNLADFGPMEPERMAEMAKWLDQDLAAAKGRADWIIVAGHQPMFNVAGHGSTWGHDIILPLLYKYGVDVVVSGHSHLYERFVPIGPPGAKPILFLVSGGGGGANYPSSPSPILVKSYAAPHYCRYHIDGDRLDLTVKTPDGMLVDQVLLTKTNGLPPQSFIDAAVPPEDAMRLLKVYKYQVVDFPSRPQAGQPVAAMLLPGHFPPDSRVTISRDPNSPWSVEDLTFQANADPVTLKITAPVGVLLTRNQNFSPPLTVAVSFQYGGHTYSWPSVTLEPTVESMKRLAPAPEPVAVPAAPAALTLDATLAGWQDVPFLHLSATQSVSRNFKLAWSKEGLFGAVLVEQAGLHPDVGLPGAGDGLEVDLKTDPARHAPPTLVRAGQVRLYLAPRSDSAPGPATVQPSSARGLKEPLRTACRKTATGYTLVFLIPAKDLSPNPLAAGQILSLDLILRHDGLIVEQFTDTSAYRSLGTPPPYGPQVYWGQIRLSGQ